MKMFRQTWNRFSRGNRIVLFVCLPVALVASGFRLFDDGSWFGELLATPMLLVAIAGLIGLGYCLLMWQDAYREVERDLKVKKGECPDCSYSLEYVESISEKTCSECGWSESKNKPVPTLYLAMSSGERTSFVVVWCILYWMILAWREGIWFSTALCGAMLCLGLSINLIRRYWLKKK